MASELCINREVNRILHRWPKMGKGWRDQEVREWMDHRMIGSMGSLSDEGLKAGVDRLLSDDLPYSFGRLIGHLRAELPDVVPGVMGGRPKCAACIDGWVEVVIWRGERATEAALRCPKCSGGASVRGVVAGWKRMEASVTRVVVACDSDGNWRALSLAERGRKAA